MMYGIFLTVHRCRTRKQAIRFAYKSEQQEPWNSSVHTMQRTILFSVFVGVCVFAVVSGAEETVEEDDNKLLLKPLLAVKPIVAGLLVGSKLPSKASNRSDTEMETEQVAPKDEMTPEYGKMATEEDRKLLLPLLAVKPLFLASMLAGSKFPNMPKPGIGFTIIKHEAAAPLPSQEPGPSPIIIPPGPTPQPPIDSNTCTSLNGFPCHRLPSGCICLVSTQKPWIDAFDYCRANGRSLLSSPSAAKQKELEMYLPTIIGKDPSGIFSLIGFWTSGLYCLTSYTWAAIPQYFSYTNWLNGEPDITNLPRSSCVRAIPTANYQWDDIDCGQFLPFICE